MLVRNAGAFWVCESLQSAHTTMSQNYIELQRGICVSPITFLPLLLPSKEGRECNRTVSYGAPGPSRKLPKSTECQKIGSAVGSGTIPALVMYSQLR